MPSGRFSSFEHDVIHHLRMKIPHYEHRYCIMFLAMEQLVLLWNKTIYCNARQWKSNACTDDTTQPKNYDGVVKMHIDPYALIYTRKFSCVYIDYACPKITLKNVAAVYFFLNT